MTKIPRSEWIALKERQPERDLICLVTNGDEVTVARWLGPERYEQWDLVGASGYEWEFDIEPTHWMALSVELPITD